MAALQGCCALSTSPDPSLLALPASQARGTLRVIDASTPGGNVLCEVEAHRGPVACMAWNASATLLASASTKGTVVRVYRMVSCTDRRLLPPLQDGLCSTWVAICLEGSTWNPAAGRLHPAWDTRPCHKGWQACRVRTCTTGLRLPLYMCNLHRGLCYSRAGWHVIQSHSRAAVLSEGAMSGLERHCWPLQRASAACSPGPMHTRSCLASLLLGTISRASPLSPTQAYRHAPGGGMQFSLAFSFRRGTYPAPIHALAFSPADAQLQLLAAASGHGTVHLFRLAQTDRWALLRQGIRPPPSSDW